MSVIQSVTLGEKIRHYRKRAGLSQLELEVEIGAATGSISRIEGGVVNPTKETLQAIAAVLKLDNTELSDLFGLQQLLPTQAEVEAAIQEVSPYFAQPNTYAYLLDEWANFYHASIAILDLLHIGKETVQKLYGKSMLEIMVNPLYGLNDIFAKEHFLEMYANEVARTRMESKLEDHFPDLVTRLLKFPEFKTCWEQADDPRKVFSQATKVVYMQVGDNRVRFHYSREKLKQNQRFEIIDIHDPQPY